MPRSSRHKSHRQSKQSSKEGREYSDSEAEDVKMKVGGSGGEKRKVSLSRNGEGGEEYVSSKVRKERGSDKSNGGDRWKGGDERDGAEKDRLRNDGERGSKSREGKSRSSKRHESGGDSKEDNGGVLEEKEYSRSGSRSEKRKSEKDSKEIREKERGVEKEKEKEKKSAVSRRGSELNLDGDVVRKLEMQSDDLVEDGHRKRSRNSAEWPSQDETRYAEVDEKRARKKKESCGDLDKYQDDNRDGSEVRRLSSRSERVKEGKSFDENNKEVNYRDKYHEDGDKDAKYHDDLDRDTKHRVSKYRDDGDRESRHKDGKYRDDGDRDGRRREDKYREDGGRDANRRDDKHRGEIERDGRRRDDKYSEDGERDNQRKDEKHREDVEKENRHSDTRYYDEADRDGRHKVEKFREDADRDIRLKEDKYRDDYERENRHGDKLGDDVDREKRLREGKYRDERLVKDRSAEKPDSKRSREENHASGFHSRKSSLYDDCDDRMPRYKDDHAEKHSSGYGRVDLTNERGRSASKMGDMDLSASRYKRQSSPSSDSHTKSNPYRLPKQDDAKYKDYGATPNREHEKKHLQRDDTNSGELAAERRSRPDVRTSPMPSRDKSPSSISERRHSRPDVWRNHDVDESGPRYGGSRDGNDFSGREPRGSRDFSMESFKGGEISEVDGDNGSVSSPFARSGHLSNSAKSLLAPTSYRTGIASPIPFGMSDDDSRGKSSNRHRRHGDTSMMRMQGNTWRGPPNWPSPMANGFMPFQHGPPPVGFHPAMQQFPAPPLFGVRPSMDMNRHGIPYHIPDPDRFSGHVRPIGWRNLVDDSCPPPLHGWEANNAAFNGDSNFFGRPGWDNSRDHPGVRPDSSSTDMGASEKQNILVHGEADEDVAGQFSQQSQLVKTPDGFQADSSEAGPPSGTVERKTSDPSLKSKGIPTEGDSEKDDDNLCRAYLSRLDISEVLAGPELYLQCANLQGLDHNLFPDGDEAKYLYLEEYVDGKAATDEVPSTFPFTAVDDSVFQKAMTLYNKSKEEFKIIKSDSLSPSHVKNTVCIPNLSGESMSLKDVAVEKMEVDCGEQEQTDLPNIRKEFKEPDGIENTEPASIPASQNTGAHGVVDKSEGSVCATSITSMEVHLSSDFEAREINDSVIEENLGLETVGSSAASVENEMTMSSDATVSSDVPISIFEGKNGGSLISDVPEVCEAVMPESIEYIRT